MSELLLTSEAMGKIDELIDGHREKLLDTLAREMSETGRAATEADVVAAWQKTPENKP